MESLNRHEDYGQESLDETHLLSDPIEQFKIWLREAEEAQIYEPNAFVLGTVDEHSHPRTRTVLLKGVDERGFFLPPITSRARARQLPSTTTSVPPSAGTQCIDRF